MNSGYFIDEVITLFANATSALCLAVDCSSNPDRSYYYQKIVDTQSLREISIGLLATLDDITRTHIEQSFSDSYVYHQILPILAERIPYYGTGSKHNSVVGLLYFALYPYHIVRVIDIANRNVISHHVLSGAGTIQLNNSGTHLLCSLTASYICFQVCDNLAPAFQIDFFDDSIIPHQAAWCAGRWCIFQRLKRKWYLLLLEERTGEILDRIQLYGQPDTISAAHCAPVVACGLDENRVQIIDINSRRSAIASHFAPTEQYNQMHVVVAPNGLRVAARGIRDQRLWCVSCGNDSLAELMPLPIREVFLNDENCLIYKPGFCLLNDRYLTLSYGKITSHTKNLPEVTAQAW